MTLMSWIIVAGGGTPGRYRATFYKLLSVEYLSHKVLLVLPLTEMMPRGIPAGCGTPGYVKQIHSICPQIIESTKNIVHFLTSYSSNAIVQCMYSFVYIVPSETIKLKSESNVANAAAFRVDWLICCMIDCPPVAICFNSQQGVCRLTYTISAVTLSLGRSTDPTPRIIGGWNSGSLGDIAALCGKSSL